MFINDNMYMNRQNILLITAYHISLAVGISDVGIVHVFVEEWVVYFIPVQ